MADASGYDPPVTQKKAPTREYTPRVDALPWSPETRVQNAIHTAELLASFARDISRGVLTVEFSDQVFRALEAAADVMWGAEDLERQVRNARSLLDVCTVIARADGIDAAIEHARAHMADCIPSVATDDDLRQSIAEWPTVRNQKTGGAGKKGEWSVLALLFDDEPKALQKKATKRLSARGVRRVAKGPP